MLFVVWVIFHVIVCVALVLVVLLQSSKGEGLAGSAFGGGGVSGAVFGGRGAATFLSKATTILAIVFFLNCGALAYMSSQTRVGGTAGSAATESAVTRQAQRAMEEQMRQQQQSQGDTTQSTVPTTAPVDTTK